MDKCFLLAALILIPAAHSLPPPESTESTEPKSVIAHRGASGKLPEHTLEAYTLAYGLGADYIEPDLMLTRDGVPIALHDRTLDATTDVAERFPQRAREDGRFYAIDFDLAEIKQLRVRERVEAASGELRYPERWDNSHRHLHFRIATLEEIIELVQGLNRVTGQSTGIYPEIKFSAWHADQDHDFEAILLDILQRHGYETRDDAVIVQSFEPESLLRLRELGCKLRLVQLISGGRAQDALVTDEGLDHIASYADGIGPSQARIIDDQGKVRPNNLVSAAHQRGLVVHPYTARTDALPAGIDSFEQLLDRILFGAGADGIFTDHPKATRKYLQERSR